MTISADESNLINNGLTNFSNSQSNAYLVYGGTQFAMPFNPNSLQWSYTLNTAAFDTIGGRVLQILSAKIDTMEWEGEAGSRTNLLALYNHIKNVQDYQISQWNAADLFVPSKGYHFSVWVRGFPAMGWNYTTVTYPYSIQFEVNEDYGNVIQTITTNALSHIVSGVGFSPYYTGVVKSTSLTTNNNTTTSANKNPNNNTSGTLHKFSPNPGA